MKVKTTRIKYGQVDFDLKITFEKNEEGLSIERAKFEEDCYYYGFCPDDYLRLLEYNGSEYELVGFASNAKKYNCVIREYETGDELRINHRYLQNVFNQEMESEVKETSNFDEINLLSEEELSILQIKLGKSKRNERDWSQIQEMLSGKEMLSYQSNTKGNLMEYKNDETQLDLENIDDLEELYNDFCDENVINYNTVDYIELVLEDNIL